MKKALITGITGQDGSYLADLLLSKGYEIHGIVRRSSSFNTERIDKIYDQIHKHYGDLCDASSLNNIVTDIMPDEIYNLGCQSHVKVSFDNPVYTTDTIVGGTLNLLEIIRRHPHIKMYQASSSEMYGSTHPMQDENSLFQPQSPYAAAKVNAYHNVNLYKNAYGLFVCNGILFNHESPRRGGTFVTKKITQAATRIKLGLQNELHLGNLDAKRDWGYSKDYMEAIWLMMQQEKPDNYVLATGESHSVQEFVEETFGLLELDWKRYVVIDQLFQRPSEVNHLCGDNKKARQILGWEPKTTFKELIKMMIDFDLKSAKDEYLIKTGEHYL